MKDKINKSESGFLENYSDNTTLRALISGIPYVGSPIDTIISNSGQQIRQQKLERTIRILKDEINRTNKSKLDKSFLDPKNEHFYDILVRMFDYSIKTRDILKIKWYCRVLVGSAIIDNIDDREYAEHFLDLISELTLSDLQIAREFYEKQKEVPDSVFGRTVEELRFVRSNGWFDLKKSFEKLSEYNVKLSISRLCKIGLLKEVGGSMSENNDGICLITPLFKRLIKFIDYELDYSIW